jgi:hypothetical protein
LSTLSSFARGRSIDARATNARRIALKKLSTELFVTQATEDVQMELDNEAPMANSAISVISALVDQKTAERTKKLETEFSKARKQLASLLPNPKTKMRGPGGASKKNKSATDKNKTPSQKPTMPPTLQLKDEANSPQKHKKSVQQETQKIENQLSQAVSSVTKRI